VVGCNSGSDGSGSAAQSTVYDRVVKSGVIRAGYLIYPPACVKDTKTGKLSGIFVETLEKAAENCGLKVEWTEEVGWAAQIEGLDADRYDIVGSPVWANSTRGKLTNMSIPVYYSGICIWVRQTDDRFTDDWSMSNSPDVQTKRDRLIADWSKINSPDVRIATIDGETGDLIARTQFPKAKRVSLPQSTDISQLFFDVSSYKADVLFAEPYLAYEYQKSNPGTVKNISPDRPIRALGNCYMFKRGEFQFKEMLDVALADMLNSGFIDDLMKKYEPEPNGFFRVAKPFRVVTPARSAP
jgi:ABC-type amino acid transport substrate-binding protein